MTMGWRGAALALALLWAGGAQAGDPDALWKIVHGQCEPHGRDGGDPSPCIRLDPRPEAGYAVLKDRVGVAQFLVIPTSRLTGVESPELLAAGSPNYWAFAWAVKPLVEERLHRSLARDQLVLTIHSAFGRSQSQLHIHVDCIRADIRDSIRRHLGEIGEHWAKLEVPLDDHPYWARRITGETLGERDPFKLLAEDMPWTREQMDRQTLAVTGATFDDGSLGFVVLADHANLAAANRGHAEELQDHDCAVGP